MWSIIIASDLHFGKSQEYLSAKTRLCNKIIDLKNSEDIEIVISAGDLTEYGTNGFTYCGVIKDKKKNKKELSQLIRYWVNPLEQNNITTLMTIGNHDSYVQWPYLHKPVFNYIEQKYGSTNFPITNKYKSGYYVFEKYKILFISLGIKPTYYKWIKEHLTHEKKMILFYHYNTIASEPYSDWWSAKEKEKFYQIIEPYKSNILFIVNGHLHFSSFQDTWRGIRMVNGAGKNTMVMVKFDGPNVKDFSLIEV